MPFSALPPQGGVRTPPVCHFMIPPDLPQLALGQCFRQEQRQAASTEFRGVNPTLPGPAWVWRCPFHIYTLASFLCQVDGLLYQPDGPAWRHLRPLPLPGTCPPGCWPLLLGPDSPKWSH